MILIKPLSVPTPFPPLTLSNPPRAHARSLSGPLPGQVVGRMRRLRELYLFKNKLDAPIPAELGQATSLLTLMMSSCNFSGENLQPGSNSSDAFE